MSTDRIWTATVPLSPAALPLGPIEVLTISGIECTVVLQPVPYLLVAARPQDELLALASRVDEERGRVAGLLNVPYGPSSPKLGFVMPSGTRGVSFAFRTRKQQPPPTLPGSAPLNVWHPGIPGTGIAAVINAAIEPRSIVGRLCRPGATEWTIATPAGVRHIRLSGTGAGILLSLGTVYLGSEA